MTARGNRPCPANRFQPGSLSKSLCGKGTVDYAIYLSRPYGRDRIQALLGLHELRRSEVAALGARRTGCHAVLPPGHRGGDQFLRYGRRLLTGHERGDHRQGLAAVRPFGASRLGHEGLQSHGRGTQYDRPFTQAHPAGLRGQPAAVGRGDHRPLPDPSFRSPYPAGRNAFRLGPPGASREGAISGGQFHGRMAVRPGLVALREETAGHGL